MLTTSTFTITESADSPDGFLKISLPADSTYKVKTNRKTSNQPLSTLTDGQLAEGFGPVFGNGIKDGMYKIDLGSVKTVSAISSWSYKQGKNRGTQKLTIFGSNANKDPGWNLNKMTPLGSITTGPAGKKHTAASLQSHPGKPIGKYRWIIWAVYPISNSGGGENTAFQELGVSILGN